MTRACQETLLTGEVTLSWQLKDKQEVARWMSCVPSLSLCVWRSLGQAFIFHHPCLFPGSPVRWPKIEISPSLRSQFSCVIPTWKQLIASCEWAFLMLSISVGSDAESSFFQITQHECRQSLHCVKEATPRCSLNKHLLRASCVQCTLLIVGWRRGGV